MAACRVFLFIFFPFRFLSRDAIIFPRGWDISWSTLFLKKVEQSSKSKKYIPVPFLVETTPIDPNMFSSIPIHDSVVGFTTVLESTHWSASAFPESDWSDPEDFLLRFDFLDFFAFFSFLTFFSFFNFNLDEPDEEGRINCASPPLSRKLDISDINSLPDMATKLEVSHIWGTFWNCFCIDTATVITDEINNAAYSTLIQ